MTDRESESPAVVPDVDEGYRRLVARRAEEGIDISPMGTEGCRWDEDYSYLEPETPEPKRDE